MAIGDTPLKLTRDAKAAIQLAFERLGDLDRLVEWANQPANLGTFYTQIWSKIIPKDVQAKIDTNQKLNITWDCDTEEVVDYTTVVNDLISDDEDDQ